MEEADLLKERLQAITDKRRIQENIAIKRRQIEEEKLKLQYIKKKALREQWLMDGLSQQSEEEQEAMRLQAQDEQQQSDQLQSNILRIEKEIEDLETQELNISANEEVVLKRLKEVERTHEDIIKELNADFQTDLPHRVTSPLPHIAAFIPLTPAKSPPKQQPGTEEPKKATFAMEITVEHDKKTGKSQVVATANITPETFRDRGLKVYEDGRKSVYALHPHGGEMLNGGVREMTPTEVEELLDRAADKDVPSDVQYYQPVYSVTYTGSSRPSTPRTANKIVKPTPSPSPSQGGISSTSGAQPYRGEMDGLSTPSKTPESSLIEQDTMLRTKKEPKRLLHPHISGEFDSDGDQPHFGDKTPQGLTNIKAEVNSPSLVSVKARTDGIPTAAQLLYKAVDGSSPSPDSSCDFNRRSPFCAENTTTLSIVKSLPEEQQSEPVTMIFMGYEKAEDEEEEDFQAELVVIGSSSSDEDEEQAQHDINGSNVEECLSYHPEGYKSKVFQPKVGMAKITGCSNDIVDTYTDWDELGLHKPTFIHKGVKHNLYLQGHGVEERANTGDINMEKMKLCSTGR